MTAPPIISATVPASAPDAAGDLMRALGDGPFDRVILFVAPVCDLEALLAAMTRHIAPERIIGCTTAGEISGQGYDEDKIVAVALPSAHFASDVMVVPDLAAIDGQALIGEMIRKRAGLSDAHPEWEGEFAFLLIDGLSLREDELTSALASGLGALPLFGGSAGDGMRFGATRVIFGGQAQENAAVLLLVRTDCAVRVFNLDHLVPTKVQMVVTDADPSRRIVRRINDEPAAIEYARVLGKDPNQLTTFTFAAHPVVVRAGGGHHVRANQRVDDKGDLVFFSAIDEGLVLTLAEPEDMVAHLDRELSRLSDGGAPAMILACDCILRRMEAMEKQRYGALSAVLRDHAVVGFSTYGEQWNSMHVNQTMTGVAIYPPPKGA